MRRCYGGQRRSRARAWSLKMARQKKDTGKPTSRHCFSLPVSDQTKRRQGSRQTGKNTSRLCLTLSHTKKDKTAKQTYGQTDKPTLFQPACVGPDRGSEADRRINRQTDKQTSSASACLSVTHTERQRSRQTYGQTDLAASPAASVHTGSHRLASTLASRDASMP